MPTIAELIKSLPDEAAQADRLPEPLASASLRPVPVGRLRRIGLLGTLQAKIAVAYLFYWIQSISTTYQITTQRVRIERGIFSKLKENVELFRVDHFELHKPLGMRLAGHCLHHLRSSDTSFPTVMILGIPNLESLADTLRECSLRERTRRRVTTFVQA